MGRGKPRFWRASLHGCAVGVCALIFFAGSLEPALTEDPDPDFKQSANRVEKIRPGGTLRVRNPFGNIYARFGGYENQVELLSTTQRLERDLPELRVDLQTGPDGMEISVDFELKADQTAPPQDGTRDHVDLVVFVPQGVTLDIETRLGSMEVKKLKSDLIASSIAGDMMLKSIKGRVRAKSERGKITAIIESGMTSLPQDIVTSTGDIEVHVWEDSQFNVELATSGVISTDFSLEIEHRRFEEPAKIGRAVLGDGGPVLKLHSKQGRVQLLRMQRDFSPE
jgi:hypothetical protein